MSINIHLFHLLLQKKKRIEKSMCKIFHNMRPF